MNKRIIEEEEKTIAEEFPHAEDEDDFLGLLQTNEPALDQIKTAEAGSPIFKIHMPETNDTIIVNTKEREFMDLEKLIDEDDSESLVEFQENPKLKADFPEIKLSGFAQALHSYLVNCVPVRTEEIKQIPSKYYQLLNIILKKSCFLQDLRIKADANEMDIDEILSYIVSFRLPVQVAVLGLFSFQQELLEEDLIFPLRERLHESWRSSKFFKSYSRLAMPLEKFKVHIKDVRPYLTKLDLNSFEVKLLNFIWKNTITKTAEEVGYKVFENAMDQYWQKVKSELSPKILMVANQKPLTDEPLMQFLYRAGASQFSLDWVQYVEHYHQLLKLSYGHRLMEPLETIEKYFKTLQQLPIILGRAPSRFDNDTKDLLIPCEKRSLPVRVERRVYHENKSFISCSVSTLAERFIKIDENPEIDIWQQFEETAKKLIPFISVLSQAFRETLLNKDAMSYESGFYEFTVSMLYLLKSDNKENPIRYQRTPSRVFFAFVDDIGGLRTHSTEEFQKNKSKKVMHSEIDDEKKEEDGLAEPDAAVYYSRKFDGTADGSLGEDFISLDQIPVDQQSEHLKTWADRIMLMTQTIAMNDSEVNWVYKYFKSKPEKFRATHEKTREFAESLPDEWVTVGKRLRKLADVWNEEDPRLLEELKSINKSLSQWSPKSNLGNRYHSNASRRRDFALSSEILMDEEMGEQEEEKYNPFTSTREVMRQYLSKVNPNGEWVSYLYYQLILGMEEAFERARQGDSGPLEMEWDTMRPLKVSIQGRRLSSSVIRSFKMTAFRGGSPTTTVNPVGPLFSQFRVGKQPSCKYNVKKRFHMNFMERSLYIPELCLLLAVYGWIEPQEYEKICKMNNKFGKMKALYAMVKDYWKTPELQRIKEVAFQGLLEDTLKLLWDLFRIPVVVVFYYSLQQIENWTMCGEQYDTTDKLSRSKIRYGIIKDWHIYSSNETLIKEFYRTMIWEKDKRNIGSLMKSGDEDLKGMYICESYRNRIVKHAEAPVPGVVERTSQLQYEPATPRFQFVYWDVETFLEGSTHVPYCICAYYPDDPKGKKDYKFYGPSSIIEFMEWISKDLIDWKYFSSFKNEKNKRDIVMVAHNGGKYDLVLLLPYLLRAYPWRVVGTPQHIREMRYLNIKMIDSYSTLPFSLRKLAKTFKVTDKGDLDFTKINSGNYLDPEIKQEVLKYCMQDCQTLSEIWGKFHEKLSDMGYKANCMKKPISASSLAFKILQYYHLEKSVYGVKLKSVAKAIRQSYMGGLVTPYVLDMRKQERRVGLSFDRNSSYPAECCELLPIIFKDNFMVQKQQVLEIKWDKKYEKYSFKIDTGSWTICDWNTIEAALIRARTLYQVSSFAFHKGVHKPNFLMKTAEGRIFSALMSDSTHYRWGVEILLALKWRKIKSIRTTYQYIFPEEKWLAEFMTHMYAERLKAKAIKDELLIFLWKLLMNSLYGKFGQKDNPPSVMVSDKGMVELLISNQAMSEEEKRFRNELMNTAEGNPFLNGVSSFEEVGPGVWVVKKEMPTEGDGTIGQCTYLASYVTAAARSALMEMTWEMQLRGFKVLYSDTDSVYVQAEKNEDGQYLGFTSQEERVDGGLCYPVGVDLNDKGLPTHLLDEIKLGYWKKEKEFDEYRCIGRKVYYCNVVKPDGSSEAVAAFKGLKHKELGKKLIDEAFENRMVITEDGIRFKKPQPGHIESMIQTSVFRPTADFCRRFDWNTSEKSSKPYYCFEETIGILAQLTKEMDDFKKDALSKADANYKQKKKEQQQTNADNKAKKAEALKRNVELFGNFRAQDQMNEFAEQKKAKTNTDAVNNQIGRYLDNGYFERN